jgi:nucleoid DNA-binding protein
MTVTKKEVVNKIAEELRLEQIDVKKIVQKTFDTIIESLSKGHKVELRNFGIFKIKSRKSRTGRNPRTGVTVLVPAKKAVVFKAGMDMRKKVA